MPQAIVTLPDFTKAKVTFDTPEQLDSTIEDLVATHPVGNLFHKDALSRGQEAIGQPLLAAATGLAGSALGGVRGLARGAGAAAGALAQGEGVGKALDVGTDEATRTIEETQKAFTVQPTSRAGEVGQAIVSWPFQKLGAGITAVAQKGGELAQAGLEKAGVSPQTAIRAGGAVAAGGEVVGQGAASLATGGLSRMALRRPGLVPAHRRGLHPRAPEAPRQGPSRPTSRGPVTMLLAMGLIGLVCLLLRERRLRALPGTPPPWTSSTLPACAGKLPSSARASPFPPPADRSRLTLYSYDVRRSRRRRVKAHPSGRSTVEETRLCRRTWRYCAADWPAGAPPTRPRPR